MKLILDFGPPKLWEDKFVVLIHSVCGDLQQQPQEADTIADQTSGHSRRMNPIIDYTETEWKTNYSLSEVSSTYMYLFMESTPNYSW